ncbi:MAG: hypothetical protein HFE30_05830 [Clostridiales bacterium]|nr:hypothetical protein [Clostridiales bacterium]
MNFNVTKILLDGLKPYFNIDNVKVSTDNKNKNGRLNRSDFVTLIERQNFCFEVFDNEIIVAFFTEHTHFGDSFSLLNSGDPDYIQRAGAFLKQLFTCPIRKHDIYKGRKILCRKYYSLKSDSTEEYIGGSWYRLCSFINPFAKKRAEVGTWQYDSAKNMFTSVIPFEHDAKAINTVAANDHCRIEIYEKGGIYSYRILFLDFDDYFGYYYWVPTCDGIASFFDTEEKALSEAKSTATKAFI